MKEIRNKILNAKQNYRDCFNTKAGEFVLNDLKNVLCVTPELLTEGYNPEVAHHIQVGMRIAYRYIQTALAIPKTNPENNDNREQY